MMNLKKAEKLMQQYKRYQLEEEEGHIIKKGICEKQPLYRDGYDLHLAGSGEGAGPPKGLTSTLGWLGGPKKWLPYQLRVQQSFPYQETLEESYYKITSRDMANLDTAVASTVKHYVEQKVKAVITGEDMKTEEIGDIYVSITFNPSASRYVLDLLDQYEEGKEYKAYEADIRSLREYVQNMVQPDELRAQTSNPELKKNQEIFDQWLTRNCRSVEPWTEKEIEYINQNVRRVAESIGEDQFWEEVQKFLDPREHDPENKQLMLGHWFDNDSNRLGHCKRIWENRDEDTRQQYCTLEISCLELLDSNLTRPECLILKTFTPQEIFLTLCLSLETRLSLKKDNKLDVDSIKVLEAMVPTDSRNAGSNPYIKLSGPRVPPPRKNSLYFKLGHGARDWINFRNDTSEFPQRLDDGDIVSLLEPDMRDVKPPKGVEDFYQAVDPPPAPIKIIVNGVVVTTEAEEKAKAKAKAEWIHHPVRAKAVAAIKARRGVEELKKQKELNKLAQSKTSGPAETSGRKTMDIG